MITDLTRERAALLRAYDENRLRTAQIFGLIAEDAYYERPIPLRHPFVFYEGHIPSFSFTTFVQVGLGQPALDEERQAFFRRGIDPPATDEAQVVTREQWPLREEVHAYVQRCDARVRDALQHARFEDAPDPALAHESAFNIIEHEQMHQETLLYIVHQLSGDKKRRPSIAYRNGERVPYRRVRIPAGTATIGAPREKVEFGWDNEFEQTSVNVDEFEIEADNVTNRDYLAYVDAGGEPPAFWRRSNGEWELMTLFDRIPLPKSWPVYVTQRQAADYAAWKGMRLPTEAQYHRAAFGTPERTERRFPWGDAPPDATHGNFGLANYDPAPVGSYPTGASAWGVNDLVGNGWEWTSTPFQPLPGFVPMKSYPVYSTDFFDNEHYVLKGASPLTHERLVRRSFRNWFRSDYPYVHATFRCVS